MAGQVDLFLDSLVDAPLRDERALMEFPFFSISKRPQKEPLVYEREAVKIVVSPGIKGVATIWDRDVLIYIASLLNERMERGLPATKKVQFAAHDFLRVTRRGTGKQAYELFKDALFRLRSTTVETTITSGGSFNHRGFGWIETFEIVEDERPDGTRRMRAVEISLSDWMYKAVTKDRRVLSISRDYFSLTGGLERRLYQLARKHVGRQREWKILLPALAEKVGSQQDLRFFKRDVKKVIEADNIPDYRFHLQGDAASVAERALVADGYKGRALAGNDRILVVCHPKSLVEVVLEDGDSE